MALKIRAAQAEDASLVYTMVTELATYEKLEHQVTSTQADFATALFGELPKVFCEIAEWQGEPVGFALWFYNFSTFRGKHGIYLEDLYVKPQARGHGIGKALLACLANRCQREGLARLEWWVLDWNQSAIEFYQKLGAIPMADWTVYRVTDQALSELAAGHQA